RRSTSGEAQQPEDGRVVARLRELLGEPQSSNRVAFPSSSQGYQDGEDESSDEEAPPPALAGGEEAGSNLTSTPDIAQTSEEALAVDDAENPLELLARASYFQPAEGPRHALPAAPTEAPGR